MEIIAENVGKRFNRDWIFKNISISIQDRTTTALTGSNGSGKSTLLQILSSITVPTTGAVSFLKDQTKIDSSECFQYISYVSPYQEIIEEMTITELLNFHLKFKELSITEAPAFLNHCGIHKGQNKEIRYFSSGMKQRVKLGLALLSDSSTLFLDEPTSNLDEQGTNWYLSEIQQQIGKKTIVIASNIPEEYSFANQIIRISDYLI